jgi:hypothetical protein
VELFTGDKISGWALLDGRNSAEMQLSVILIGNDASWRLPVCRTNRADVAKSFGQSDLYLKSGYTAYLDLAGLPAGKYEVKILLENKDQSAEISTGLIFSAGNSNK